MPMIFVNLPVTDLPRAITFYEAVGCAVNPDFTDEKAACLVVEADRSAFMLLTRDFFQSFLDVPVGDPSSSAAAITAVMLDSRADVDARATAGLDAGGSEPRPAVDLGFMYQRQLRDPDGNVIELGHMDPIPAGAVPDADGEVA
ncbi:glyoxalase [Clavibacter michiganensis subsp. michiganensis]|uniref:VOC family protein n=2 Tax=Clavibacter michiganensis TaxID=28447 RepID=UPI00136535E6|nr:VOC family protein [Clavibacter michiganensis]MWJ23687.1 glyoxalase [Clavibacter michiganensis subsp. michiganensis]UOW04154.1 glyoxalase [Clavibacter michiganensis subsp. michiganensis]